MGQAGTTFVSTILNWADANRLKAVAGAVATIFGLVVGASNVVPVIKAGLNIPDCNTYATVYWSPWSYFKQEGDVWREYPLNGGQHRYEFKEFSRTRESIVLHNLTFRDNEPLWENLMVRLPVCGGAAELGRGIPQHWEHLAEIHR